MRLSKTCADRSDAMRAARAACRRALDAPAYRAAEGPDLVLRPGARGIEWRISRLPHRYKLRGPAPEALRREAETP
ncbi:hypothetical protein [uncultured Jannaschia sp.]|uniref:hypothetical protein n=1 Tax=uncultured Jannaschia sp. TaxID=293347 RepID=UPI00262EA23F|nr:hypothetical protein [uncultured Jannaschia sp.]